MYGEMAKGNIHYSQIKLIRIILLSEFNFVFYFQLVICHTHVLCTVSTEEVSAFNFVSICMQTAILGN